MKAKVCIVLIISLFCSLIGFETANATSQINTDTKQTYLLAEQDNRRVLKVGIILIGDENEGYSYAHIDGIQKAMRECGLKDSDIVWCKNIPESQECYEQCVKCINAGCNLIVSNSYGHQEFMQQAAKKNPNIHFVALAGDNAKKSGLKNLHNASNKEFEARFVSGVVAGMKLRQMTAAGTISDPYIGFVGAFPYAEVISAYTSFFLGARYVVPDVHMDVQYTYSWFNIQDEKTVASNLIDRGCNIIGQYSDSIGAPKAVEAARNQGKEVYSIGSNLDMRFAAPTVALTSSTEKWNVYFTYLFSSFKGGLNIATDWAQGYNQNAVGITTLGSSVAPGTSQVIKEIEDALKKGTLHVFDINTFRVNGKIINSAMTYDSDGDYIADQNEGIVDGYYHESEYISAPSFDLRIDGITEINGKSVNNNTFTPISDKDKPSDWASEQVSRAVSLNLVAESLQSSYGQVITRAEFCALATSLYETQIGTISERKSFLDTNDPNVEKMAALGVVSGIGDGKFLPDGALTREQAATMLSRLATALGTPIGSKPTSYLDDAEISSWAAMAIGEMQNSGIMNGVGNGRFSPKGNYTREQSIVTILRLLDYYSSKKPA